MKTLILSHSDIERLLGVDECIEAMAAALSDLARGHVYLPQRMVLTPPGAAGFMGLMPAYTSGDEPGFGLKAVCVFPANAAKGKDIHQGAVALYSPETGEIQALMNASAITAKRTAAVSALATRTLARDDARVVTIIGAGVQGEAHLEAIARVRDIREARVADRDAQRAQDFARRIGPSHAFPVVGAGSVEEALKGADIVMTVTTSSEPVLRREWLAEGAHINAVGACAPQAREIDSATMAAAKIFVDRREATFAESGDYLIAAAEGAVGPDSIRAELGEVLIGAAPGRTSSEEITLFEALGLAVEDLACARLLYRVAQQARAGTWVDF